jgi:imidazole glycerol-phosphate synthase subunit HisF
MILPRVIPVLLLKGAGLAKGIQFKQHRYVGDPINAVKIFNEKEVDELVFYDISATSENRAPNYEVIRNIASEAFMPLAYGGGISDVRQIEKLFNLGIEKVIINSAAYKNPDLVREASSLAGSQSIIAAIDYRTNIFGNSEVYIRNGTVKIGNSPTDYALHIQELGAGEIILCSIDREGTGRGYDLDQIRRVSSKVDIPVVAVGGAGSLDHFAEAVISAGASAVAAGDMFVFHGKHRAVLITYPGYEQLKSLFASGDQ